MGYSTDLKKILQHIQDADSCLLGLNAGTHQDSISKAMELHREAARMLIDAIATLDELQAQRDALAWELAAIGHCVYEGKNCDSDCIDCYLRFAADRAKQGQAQEVAK